jgi:hypothetical protein
MVKLLLVELLPLVPLMLVELLVLVLLASSAVQRLLAPVMAGNSPKGRPLLDVSQQL